MRLMSILISINSVKYKIVWFKINLDYFVFMDRGSKWLCMIILLVRSRDQNDLVFLTFTLVSLSLPS